MPDEVTTEATEPEQSSGSSSDVPSEGQGDQERPQNNQEHTAPDQSVDIPKKNSSVEGENETNVNSPAYLKFSGGLILFDYVMRMDHSLNVVVTSHPVMKGAEISDHAFREPTEVTLEIAYNDTVIGSEEGHSYKAFEVLYNLMEARELLTLTTRLKTYNNMIITSISVPDDHTTIKALKATVILKEVKIVTVQTVEIQKQVTSSETVDSGAVPEDDVSYDSGSSSKANGTTKSGTKNTKKADELDVYRSTPPTKEMIANDPLGKLTLSSGKNTVKDAVKATKESTTYNPTKVTGVLGTIAAGLKRNKK